MNEMVSVPYVVYEQEKAHHDREKKRWFIVCLVLILALIATNVAWVIYESQFEKVTETEVVTVLSMIRPPFRLPPSTWLTVACA